MRSEVMTLDTVTRDILIQTIIGFARDIGEHAPEDFATFSDAALVRLDYALVDGHDAIARHLTGAPEDDDPSCPLHPALNGHFSDKEE